MVYNTEEIIERANDAQTNAVGTCQFWTRTIIGVESAGDRDQDGDADAVDGWKSEPLSARHEGDRDAPEGMPVAFSGGSRGFGHRAVSLGKGKIRSTDMSDDGSRYQPGNVGTTTIAQIEKSMGVKYTGWSETMTGIKIPKPSPTTRGPKVEKAIKQTQFALENTKTARRSESDSKRAKLLEAAENRLQLANKALTDVPKIARK